MSAKTSNVQAKAGVVMLEDYSTTLLKASAKNAGLNCESGLGSPLGLNGRD